MSSTQSQHPNDQVLHAYGLGKLDEPTAESVHQHLEKCTDCRRRVAEMSSDSFLDRLRAAKGARGTANVGGTRLEGSHPEAGSSAAADRSDSTLPPGLDQHPDYEIKKELGRGGMGVVYLAHNRLMGRDEVLKVMGRQLVEMPGVMDRFLREIRAVGRLRHPNIVTAYSAFRLGESVVFAMEYVDGFDLSRTVKSRGPLPIGHACLFVYETAMGLQHAHEEGTVHRDIKPANLMLSRRGDKAIVKILDFGLAKASSEALVGNGLTQEGQLLGTPDYMAPEQWVDAQKADIRADIYSLGCTLYYLLSGRPPFRGKSVYDMFQAHHSMDAPPLDLARPQVPVELAALVAKMMSKNPQHRFQTPRDVANALKPFFKSGSVSFRSPGLVAAQSGQKPIRPDATPKSALATPTTIANPQTDEGWDSLIEFREAGTSMAPGRRRSRPLWQIGAAIATVSLIGLSLPLVGFAIKKNAGTRIVSDGGKDVNPITTGADLERDVRLVPRVQPPAPFPTPTPPAEPPSTEKRNLPEPPALASTPPTPPLPVPVESPKPILSKIGLKLMPIPSGEFLMGSPVADAYANDDESPQHKVRISRPFYLGATEVTVAQFREVVEKTAYVTEAEWKGAGGGGWNPATVAWENAPRFNWLNPGFPQEEDHPVVLVSWKDAIEFCNRLSRIEGLKPYYHFEARQGGDGYRLPSEAEWEYACRAGTTTIYQSGDDPEGLAHVGNIADASKRARYSGQTKKAITARDGFVHTAPVGRFKPNAFGLFDMHGNAEEWCWDGYDARFYARSPEVDPLGPQQFTLRVTRGGNWWTGPFKVVRSAGRMKWQQNHRAAHTGFRVARDQPAK